MELKRDLSLTETFETGGDYQIIAWYHGHELIYFEKYGSYQGEWIMVSFDSDNQEYYIWRDSYGSCSGCDAYEAEISYRDENRTRIAVKEFCEGYDPFSIVPRDTMENVIRGGVNRVKEVIPANQRDWYDVSIDEVADAIYLGCKIHGNIDLTFEDILNARNIDLRQTGLENYGYERFVEDADAEVIDNHNGDQLLALGEMRILRLVDPSTMKVYLLPVPDWIKRAKEGLAWSFNMTEDAYNPIIET